MNPFEGLNSWYSYEEFLAFTDKLVAAGKTTGPDQSAEMVEYTRLNLHRMKRWGKTFRVSAELEQAAQTTKPQTWWVITEPWCGDSAHSLAQLAQIAATSVGRISIRIILRDEHPALMDRYLTNGSRSIPVLASFDDEGSPLFVWGPRPAVLQEKVLLWKSGVSAGTYADLKTEVHTWYNNDKGEHLSAEILQLLSKTAAQRAA